MKNRSFLVWVLLGTLLETAYALPHRRPFQVVIDPGHGGIDEGTVFENKKNRVTEKALTLLLAQQVAQELKSKNISVTLTRTDDRDVPLGERTALANRMGADLFLSIHINSAKTDAQGIETFILNNTTNESSRRLAQLENTVLGSDDLSQENVDLALILRDLKLDANLGESKRLACNIQSHLIAKVSHGPHALKNRGIKQALFHVLLGAEMPSALVEAGFLSHSNDRSFMVSSAGQKTMGTAIAHAIDQFRRQKGSQESQDLLKNCE